MATESGIIYLCPNGHRQDGPGTCPRDGIPVEPAHYLCPYCGYATRSSKTGQCPHCDARMLGFPPPDHARRRVA